MPDASFIQSSFLGGEWSRFAQGRVDRPDYRTAMNVCLNGLPIETGTWVRRPGFGFAGLTRFGAPAHLIKFDFDQSSPYQIEITNGHLRFWSGINLITTPDSGIPLVTISTANPAVAQLSGPVAWATGDQAYFGGLGTTSPLLQSRVFAVTMVDSSHAALFDSLSGAPIDGSTLGWVSTPGATLSKVMDIIAPWSDPFAVRSVQSEETAFLLSSAVRPQALLSTEHSPYATFSLTPAQFNDGPYLDPDTSGVTMTPSNVAGTGRTMTASGTSATFPGFQTSDIGRHMRILSEPPQWIGGISYAVGDAVRDKGAYYGVVAAVTGSAVPPAGDPTHFGIAPQNARWAWLKITGIAGASPSLQATFDYASGNFVYAWNPSTIYPSATWRLGLYSDTMGWPTCGTYSDGRIWLSGVAKNRIDSSTANGIKSGVISFGPTGNGLGADDPNTFVVTDANAISYTFNAPDSNPILWMIPDLQGIICGTQAGEWLVIAPTTGGISPFNIAARRVTKIGCANIEPRRTEHTTIFVQGFGRKIMEYFADVYSGKFTAPHLTFTAKHLTKGGIDEIAYQHELSPTVWARIKGKLIGCTYKRDTLMTSQGPSAAGWHRHTLGSGRVVESISVGPSIGGTTDSLTIITNDTGTNVRHVEVMNDILDEGSALTEARYFDDSVTPSSVTEATVVLPGRPYGGLILNGLWHLNGKTVTAWLGGLDCGDYVVTSGSITVPYGDGISAGTAKGLFTNAFVGSFSGLMPMCVGFDFTSDGQIVRVNSKEESGARSGPAFGKKRRNHMLAVQLEGARGGYLGTTFSKLDPALFKYDNDARYPINVQFNGIHRPQLTDDYSYDGMLCWRVNRGYIFNVAAVGGFLQTQDA